MSVAVIDRNDVVLCGKLSGAPEERVLPSGDPLVVFRITVRRPRPLAGRTGQDTLPCVTYDKSLQKRVLAWQDGDVVEVAGALQRRFWRTGTGTASVCEVNCRRGRKLSRAAAEARTA